MDARCVRNVYICIIIQKRVVPVCLGNVQQEKKRKDDIPKILPILFILNDFKLIWNVRAESELVASSCESHVLRR